MKYYLSILSLIGLFGAFSSCILDTNSPPSVANYSNLTIEYYLGGGMRPQSETIYISNDSAFVRNMDMGEETIQNWIPEKKEMDDLYQNLIDNSFTQIESMRESNVYDRGGVVLTITVDGVRTEINDNGNSFIVAKWRDNFSSILQKIMEYKALKVGE